MDMITTPFCGTHPAARRTKGHIFVKYLSATISDKIIELLSLWVLQ